MLLFYGKETSVTVNKKTYDENVSRAARLRALRSCFYEWKEWSEFAPDQKDTQTHAFNIAIQAGLPSMIGDKSVVVINAHGSPTTLSGLSSDQVAQDLLNAQIVKAGTKEIWVAACNVAVQEQDNTHRPDTFVKELYRSLRKYLPDIKVYGPRGYVSYSGAHVVPVGGQSTLAYKSVIITLRGKNSDGSTYIKERYKFPEGWLLAQLP